MANTKFVLPTTFQKELALTTQKVYISKLNNLAKEGYDTTDKLKSDSVKVIQAIKKITGDGDDEKSRNARRYYISAIFWVQKFPKKNAYYTYYQKCLPLKVMGTEKDWKKKTEYNPDAE
jgi:hypothetical protein